MSFTEKDNCFGNEWRYRHTSAWQPGVIVRVGVSWPLESDPEIPRKVKEATKKPPVAPTAHLPSAAYL